MTYTSHLIADKGWDRSKMNIVLMASNCLASDSTMVYQSESKHIIDWQANANQVLCNSQLVSSMGDGIRCKSRTEFSFIIQNKDHKQSFDLKVGLSNDTYLGDGVGHWCLRLPKPEMASIFFSFTRSKCLVFWVELPLGIYLGDGVGHWCLRLPEPAMAPIFHFIFKWTFNH